MYLLVHEKPYKWKLLIDCSRILTSQKVVAGANTPNKKNHPLWKGLKYWAIKGCQKLCSFLFEATRLWKDVLGIISFFQRGREGTHLLWRAAFLVYVVGMVASDPNALLGQAGHEVNLRLREGSVSSENSDVVVLVPATAAPPPTSPWAPTALD